MKIDNDYFSYYNIFVRFLYAFLFMVIYSNYKNAQFSFTVNGI